MALLCVFCMFILLPVLFPSYNCQLALSPKVKKSDQPGCFPAFILWCSIFYYRCIFAFMCLHCFDAVGWAAGRASTQSGKNLRGAVMLAWLSGARCKYAYGPDDATATHCLLLH